MGLKDLVEDVDPRKKEGHCPACGAEGEETGRLELRCPKPREECDTLYWFKGRDSGWER